MVTELKPLGHSRARYRFELANVRTSEGIVFENGVVVPDREISVWARGPFRALTQNGQSGNAGALWLKNGIGDIVMTHKD